mmetsp:Transcript_104/g.343  ORF Transcript_104/g.343 Transcript_104/m.343 type:complete len:219 (+) Transcript_104:743-1399(+)
MAAALKWPELCRLLWRQQCKVAMRTCLLLITKPRQRLTASSATWIARWALHRLPVTRSVQRLLTWALRPHWVHGAPRPRTARLGRRQRSRWLASAPRPRWRHRAVQRPRALEWQMPPPRLCRPCQSSPLPLAVALPVRRLSHRFRAQASPSAAWMMRSTLRWCPRRRTCRRPLSTVRSREGGCSRHLLLHPRGDHLKRSRCPGPHVHRQGLHCHTGRR